MNHIEKSEALTVLALLGFLKTECSKYATAVDLGASIVSVLELALEALEGDELDYSVLDSLTYLKPIEHDGVDLRMLAVMEISNGDKE